MLFKRNLLLLSYLRAYKVFPTPVRRSYLHAYKAPFYVSFCTFCASLRLKRTVFRRPIQSLPTYQVSPCNPWLIKDLRSTKDYVRKNNLFMQNEPKFRKSQMNVSDYITRDYEQMDTWSIRKNEPKRTQNKPN
jgi:hypothetical protein